MKPTASDVDAASTEWFSSAERFWGEQREKGPWEEEKTEGRGET